MQIQQIINSNRADFAPSCPRSPVTDFARVNQLKHYFVKVARQICPDYRITQEQKLVINDIFNWCLMLQGNLDPNKGLWLHGDIGSGKTTMLKIVKRFCHDVRPKVNGDYYSFRISNAIEVCGEFSQRGYSGIETYIDSRQQAFDEIGSECAPTAYYGTVENVFQYILQRRYDRRHESFTHVTTNLEKQQIIDRYDARIFDRCKEMFNFVEFNGVTFRKE